MAMKSKDEVLVRDILLDEITFLIEKHPSKIADALNKSNYKVSSSASKETLASKVSVAIHENKQFRDEISKLIATYNAKHSNVWGAIIGAVGTAVGGVFGAVKANKETKAQEEETRRTLLEKLGSDGKRGTTIVMVTIAGLIIATIAILVIKNRQEQNG